MNSYDVIFHFMNTHPPMEHIQSVIVIMHILWMVHGVDGWRVHGMGGCVVGWVVGEFMGWVVVGGFMGMVVCVVV